MEIFKYIKDKIPFELKRSSSFLSVIIALIIAGFFTKAGEVLLEKILEYLKPYIPKIWAWLITLITFKFEVNFIGIIIFAILLFPIYRKFDKLFLIKSKGEVIFIDKFNIGNKGWNLNYWGSNNPQKTNRIEKSMIFEAKEGELQHKKNEFGAYLDLKNGIYKDNEYEISCKVRAEKNTTMKFCLWLHDTKGGATSIRSPFNTPPIKNEVIKLKFTANESEAIRIHLHNKAGEGKIIVEEVVVKKI